MDFKDYTRGKQEVFKQLNPTIGKAFSGDAEERKGGRKELEKLCGKDEVVPLAIGNAHQIEYDYTEDLENAQKTVEKYKRIVNEGHASVAKNIQDLGARLKN